MAVVVAHGYLVGAAAGQGSYLRDFAADSSLLPPAAFAHYFVVGPFELAAAAAAVGTGSAAAVAEWTKSWQTPVGYVGHFAAAAVAAPAVADAVVGIDSAAAVVAAWMKSWQILLLPAG